MKNKYKTLNVENVISEEKKGLNIGEDTETLGIALSGGGIRSASFGLGVLQALMAHGVLQKADYLSTVSGGGYIGSSLTWFRKNHVGKNDEFFDNFQPFGEKEGNPPSHGKSNFVNFLRQHGNYLFPGKGLNYFSTIAVLTRSLFTSALIYFTIVLLTILLLILLSRIPVFDEVYIIEKEIVGSIYEIFKVAEGQEIVKGYEWEQHTLFRFTIVMVVLYLALGILIGMTLHFFTIITRKFHLIEIHRYNLRVILQQFEGVFFITILMTTILATIPMVEVNFKDQIPILGIIGYLSGAWSALSKMRIFMGKVPFIRKEWISNLLFRIGSILFIYAVLAMSYHINLNYFDLPAIINDPLYIKKIIPTILIIVIVVFPMAWILNINDLTVGSLYRDRLMEAFLPDNEAVNINEWKEATDANFALLQSMCKEDRKELNNNNTNIRKPYHLINTNIILFRALNKKYKNRKGDNFLLSPLYCGSEATKYISTDEFMKNSTDEKIGITLATAMATSGAAVNPHAGIAGVGPTCDRFVAFLMTFFNLRLGFWATNPIKGAPRSHPNYLKPGLCSLLSSFGHREDKMYIELSDGGHFENLGIYELVRRRVDTIIVSDGSADKDFTFGDLANAIERVRADFGVNIRFKSEEIQLGNLLPSSCKDGAFAKKFNLACKSYACGTIEYPYIDTKIPKKNGTIYLIKSTLIANLPADIYGYRARFSDFPDQTTGDQFFDENQFDAYRELGYRASIPLASNLTKYST